MSARDRLAMFRTRAVWAYSRLLQAEKNPEDITATLAAYGLGGFHQEIYYGLTAQGDIDRGNGARAGEHAPRSIAEAAAEAERFRALGIAYVPVVVPRGLAGEAELHGALGRALGALVVDLETGEEYWPWEQRAAVRSYVAALRAATGPGCVIGWQPDGRLADQARAGEWAAYVSPAVGVADVWLPQLYSGWSVYGLGDGAVAADARRFGRFAALGPALPTLYTAESLAEPAALWEQVRAAAAGLCAFRFGATGPAGLALLRDLALSVPEPEPAVTEDGVRIGLALKVLTGAYRAARDDLNQMIGA